MWRNYLTDEECKAYLAMAELRTMNRVETYSIIRIVGCNAYVLMTGLNTLEANEFVESLTCIDPKESEYILATENNNPQTTTKRHFNLIRANGAFSKEDKRMLFYELLSGLNFPIVSPKEDLEKFESQIGFYESIFCR